MRRGVLLGERLGGERGEGLRTGGGRRRDVKHRDGEVLFYLVKIIREAVAIFKINDLKKHDIKGRLLRPPL